MVTVDPRYRSLKVTKINTYGLVFHWQGSDEELMPVLMTAHQGEMILRVYTLF